VTPKQMSALHKRAFPNTRNWSTAEFETLVQKPTTILTQSEFGFACGQLIAPDCDLLTIAIDPKAQGKGHGKSLLAKFLGEIALSGARRCLLEVDADNKRLVRFYQAAGFQEINRLVGYYTRSDGSKSDACIMERRLSSE